MPLLRALLLSCLLLCIAWPGQARQDAPSAPSGGTMVYARGNDALSLDPVKGTDNESIKVFSMIYEGLVRFDPGSTAVLPALAESWAVSPDGLEYVFHLRRGVFFHDGTPLDAKAAASSLNRLLGSDTSPLAPYYQYIKYVMPLDAQSLKIVLRHPNPDLLPDLAVGNMRIVSPAAVAAYGENLSRHPVGTGPFRLASWNADNEIVLEANAAYWQGPPAIDRLIFKVVPDNFLRMSNLLSGVVQVIDGIMPSDMRRLSHAPGVRVIERPGLNTAYLALNTSKPPLDSLKVRQAVALALAKGKLAKLLVQGMGSDATTLTAPLMNGSPAPLPPQPYDPDRARKLLAEAGFPRGLELDLWTMDIPRPYLPNPMDAARLIQANLASAGIRVRILKHSWESHLAGTSRGEHSMCLLGLSAETGTPLEFLYTLLSSQQAVAPKARNKAFVRDQVLDELLAAARNAGDVASRREITRRIELRNRELAAYIPLVHMKNVVATRDNVTGLSINTFGQVCFEKARLASEDALAKR